MCMYALLMESQASSQVLAADDFYTNSYTSSETERESESERERTNPLWFRWYKSKAQIAQC